MSDAFLIFSLYQDLAHNYHIAHNWFTLTDGTVITRRTSSKHLIDKTFATEHEAIRYIKESVYMHPGERLLIINSQELLELEQYITS